MSKYNITGERNEFTHSQKRKNIKQKKSKNVQNFSNNTTKRLSINIAVERNSLT